MDATNRKGNTFNGIEGKSESKKNGKIGCELVVRGLALALTLAAAVVLGVNKQNKIVSLQLVPSLPPIDVPTTAKASYLSAFVYNISVNAIACGYAAISMVILTVSRGKSKGLVAAVLVGDLVMVALLFSGTGAAGAIGLMGFKGNEHVMWNKVCDVFGKFCHQAVASLFLSFLGSVAFLSLVVFDAMRLPDVATN